MSGKSVVDSAGMSAIKITTNSMKKTNGVALAEMRSIDSPVNPETIKRFNPNGVVTNLKPKAVVIICKRKIPKGSCDNGVTENREIKTGRFKDMSVKFSITGDSGQCVSACI
jgi:hypothetical protein